MAVRLWTAVLPPATVFAVHGAQCTAAADGAAHTSTPATHLGAATALRPAHAHPAAAALTTLAGPMDAATTRSVGVQGGCG